jgi:prophage DNA circulation protein
MAALWDDILQDGKFDGVRFDFVRSTFEGGNDIDQQRFPNSNGQQNQGRGRKGRRFRILGIFIEEDYPDTMNALVAKLENGGAPKEFVDPVWGSMQASVDSFSINHDADDARDSATVDISFVEHTTGTQGPRAITSTTPARANAVRSSVNDVFVALSAFQAATEVQNDPHVLEVTGLVNAATSSVSSIADSFEDTGDQLAAPVVQAQANASLVLIDSAVASNADYDSTESYDLGAALLAMAAALSAMAQDLIEAKPPLVRFPVLTNTDILRFTHDLYGDSARAQEVLDLNSIPDPMDIPAGFPGGIAAYAA